MKSIDKLREMCKYRHLVVNTSMTSDGTTVANFGSPLVETIDDIIGNIEAEIERNYMPKPKIEKNFNAINSGITDISEALQNIAECNAAKCAMRQEVTHADVETMIGSIAAIADAYYMRLPVDVDGVPIHVGDICMMDGDQFEVRQLRTDGDYWWVTDRLGCFCMAKECHHVKPRTLEDVLNDYLQEREKIVRKLESSLITLGEAESEEDACDKLFAERIRKLLGGDAS